MINYIAQDHILFRYDVQWVGESFGETYAGVQVICNNSKGRITSIWNLCSVYFFSKQWYLSFTIRKRPFPNDQNVRLRENQFFWKMSGSLQVPHRLVQAG